MSGAFGSGCGAMFCQPAPDYVSRLPVCDGRLPSCHRSVLSVSSSGFRTVRKRGGVRHRVPRSAQAAELQTSDVEFIEPQSSTQAAAILMGEIEVGALA